MLTTLLTSGYYDEEDRVPPHAIQNGHKDRHGGPFARSVAPGLRARPQPRQQRPLSSLRSSCNHDDAADLATDATKKYIHEITRPGQPAAGRPAPGKGTDARPGHRHHQQHGADHRGGPEAAVELVNNRLGTAQEPSQYVLGQIDDPVTPAPVVTANPDDFKSAITALTTSPQASIVRSWQWRDAVGARSRRIPAAHSSSSRTLARRIPPGRQRDRARPVEEHPIDCSSSAAARRSIRAYIQIANETGGQVFFLTPAEVDARRRSSPACWSGRTRSTCSRCATPWRAGRRPTTSRSIRP